jgi:hypothetical protein
MKCPECEKQLKRILVSVEGAEQKAVSYQCSCGHVVFERDSSERVLAELRDAPLKIRQHIIALSKGRLGMYLNSDVVRSLDIRKGEEVTVSVPDRKHIVIERKGAA